MPNNNTRMLRLFFVLIGYTFSACAGSDPSEVSNQNTNSNSIDNSNQNKNTSNNNEPDTTAPVINDGQPTGQLAADTTQATLSVVTNEEAECRYVTKADTSFDAMLEIFDTTNKTTHTHLLLELQNSEMYTYYIRCQDIEGNANTQDFVIMFSVATSGPGDTTPPVISNGQPSGELVAGTTDATISVTTDENATCKYATTPDVVFENMTETFSSTGDTLHSISRNGLLDGISYSFFVRCQDTFGNANTSDYMIAFNIADSGSTDYDLVGLFAVNKIMEDSGGGFTNGGVDAYWGIYDKPYPGIIMGVTLHDTMWEVGYSEGDCVYLVPMLVGYCDNPVCDSTEWCTPDDVCETLPVHKHAGTLTFTGLNTTITMDPDAQGKYTSVWDLRDNFSSHSQINLSASGGPTPAFSVFAPGVDFLAQPLNCSPDLQAGEDYIFTWTPENGDAFVRLDMPTFKHAGWSPMILCETPDTGVLVVPAAIVDLYLADLDPSRVMSISRVQRSIVGIGNNKAVALEVTAGRVCFIKE